MTKEVLQSWALDAQKLIEKQRALLAVAHCPAKCIDGAIPEGDPYSGDCYQCQFCHERAQLAE
jgi:hypothetical protein